MNANIIIVFLGYTCQKTISMNNTFRDCRSKVNITKIGLNSANLGIIKMKQKLICKKNYSYVATATMIQFHFQFPRSPDAPFGGLIRWLFNWKCKFSCRIKSNIANHLKYNDFWDGDGIDNVTLRLYIFSDFCSRHTVGVAGDDIMFHILVMLSNHMGRSMQSITVV